MDDIRREIEQLTVTKKSSNKGDAAKGGSPGIDETFSLAKARPRTRTTI